MDRSTSFRSSSASFSGRRTLTSEPALYTRLDSLDLRDSNYLLAENKVWFDPMSTFRGCWDTVVLLCIIYTMLVLPIHIAFDFRLDLVDWSVDALFLADVLLNFETGYSFRGNLITDRRKVRRRYLTTWFAIDLVSSIPSEIVLMHLNRKRPGLQLAMRLAPMAKVLRVPRLFRYMMRWRELIPVSSSVLRSFTILSGGLVFCHWNACQLFLIAELEGFPEDSWLVRSGLIDDPPFDQYTHCLLASLCHMTGQGAEAGAFKPATLPEIWACMFSVAVGVTFYTFLLGMVGTILQSQDREVASTHMRIDKWVRFCRVNSIPGRLQKQGFQALATTPNQRNHNEDLEVLQGLRPELRSEVILCIKCNMIRSSPVFSGCEEKMVEALARCLLRQTYMEGEVIGRLGELVPAAYFVVQGEVQALDGEQEVQHELTRGDCFGEECLLHEMEQIHLDSSNARVFNIFQGITEPTEGLTTPRGSFDQTSSPGSSRQRLPPVWSYMVTAGLEGTICYALPHQKLLEAVKSVPVSPLAAQPSLSPCVSSDALHTLTVRESTPFAGSVM